MIFYTIWMNKTMTPDPFMKPVQRPIPKEPGLMQLQNSVDNGILKYLHNKKDDSD